MKANKKLILILVLLLAVATYFYFNSNSSTLKKELSDFAIKDTSAITKIFMADKAGNKVLLERMGESKWSLNGKYKARQDAINNLLLTMNRVSVKTPVNKAAFETVLKSLASASTKVEIYIGDEKDPSKVYFVGGPNQDHNGTFMLLENSSVPFLTHMEGFNGFLTPRYFTSENDWKDREVFRYKYGEIASIQVEYPQDEESSFVINEVGKDLFTLKKLKTGELITEIDTARLFSFIASFQKINYESAEETKDSTYKAGILRTTPQEIYTVTDKLGNVKTVKTFLKPAHEGATDLEGNPIDFDLDRLYATINDKEFVVIQYFVFDVLKRKVDDFRAVNSVLTPVQR